MDYVWEKYPKRFDLLRSAQMIKNGTKAVRRGTNSIDIYFSTLVSDGRPLKAPYFELVREKVPKLSGLKNLLEESNWGTFTRQTQFLHKTRTTGTEQLELLARATGGEDIKQAGEKGPTVLEGVLDEKSLQKRLTQAAEDSGEKWQVSSGEAKLAASKVIQQMFDRIAWSWASDEDMSSRDYLKSIQIEGTLGPTLDNAPGEEAEDWSNLRGHLEAFITAELNKTRTGDKLITKSASPSPLSKVRDIGVNNILDRFKSVGRRYKEVDVTTPKTTRPKENTDKSNLKRVGGAKKVKAGRAKKPRKLAPVVAKTTKDTKRTMQSPINLITLLNNKLPEAIKANMSTPYLVNRTGRFAGSVKVMNVLQNKQHPTIQYTYQRYPYDTFESDPERDPRKLINLTIREVAAQVMTSRFYTKRV